MYKVTIRKTLDDPPEEHLFKDQSFAIKIIDKNIGKAESCEFHHIPDTEENLAAYDKQFEGLELPKRPSKLKEGEVIYL